MCELDFRMVAERVDSFIHHCEFLLRQCVLVCSPRPKTKEKLVEQSQNYHRYCIRILCAHEECESARNDGGISDEALLSITYARSADNLLRMCNINRNCGLAAWKAL